jgi:hypothetical protein
MVCKGGRLAAKVWAMRDWVADWNKWSPGERLLAVFLTGLMAAFPLGLLLAATVGV